MKAKTAKAATASKSGQQPSKTDHVAAGEKAFAAVEARLLALPSDRLSAVTVDVQVAAIIVLGVAKAIAADTALRARFEALAKVKEFDLAKLDGLVTVAHAAWFARHMYLLTNATSSEAQLPGSLVATATSLKTRMMRVVDYHLGDHPVAGPLVTAIRAGTGYMDLANDLVALSRLYKAYAHLLEHDRKDYQAMDQGLAAQIGDQILTLLGGNTPEQRKWVNLQARAWTLLSGDYAEVFAAGRYLKRGDGFVDNIFPSLIAAARAAGAKPASGPSEGAIAAEGSSATTVSGGK